MKRTLVICTLAGILATGPALAEVDDAAEEGRRGLWGFGGGAVAGALLAGPPGMVGGAILGAFIGRGEDLEQQRDELRLALHERDRQLAEMHVEQSSGAPIQVASRSGRSPDPAPQPLREIARGVAEGVQIHLHFRTGSAEVESQYDVQLTQLPAVLNSLPDLDLMLSGHADRRGGDDDNLHLSRARVEQVAQRLMAAGVAPERLHIDHFGETRPLSQAGDAEAYAFDRRVQLRFLLREAPGKDDTVALSVPVTE